MIRLSDTDHLKAVTHLQIFESELLIAPHIHCLLGDLNLGISAGCSQNNSLVFGIDLSDFPGPLGPLSIDIGDCAHRHKNKPQGENANWSLIYGNASFVSLV